MPEFNIRKTIDNVAELVKRVNTLTGSDVFVGVPASKSSRKQGQIGNADLAYIHEFGSPAHNIPARPFLHPGIRRVKDEIVAMMKEGMKNTLEGKGKPEQVLERVGMLARNSVVNEITDPDPPFVPLKAATIRARLRRTAAGRRKLRSLKQIKAAAGWKAEQSNEALTEWAEAGNAKPLIDTGQLRASITYVVRSV
jgi:phage gpG-like protein